MNLKELCVGNVVRTRNNHYLLVLPDGSMYNKNWEYMNLEVYLDSLENGHDKDWDIVCVYKKSDYTWGSPLDNIYDMSVLWIEDGELQDTTEEINMKKIDLKKLVPRKTILCKNSESVCYTYMGRDSDGKILLCGMPFPYEEYLIVNHFHIKEGD